MRLTRSRLVAACAVVLAAAGGVLAAGSFASGHKPAAAQRTAALAQRTFVSAASGNDANPCTRTAPCRNFAAAIAQTSPGGEVIVLDSGGYGTVNITQAVSLIAPPGVYAGISVFAGAGITINAGPTDVVTLRGLTLNGLGGDFGVQFFSGAALYVEDTVVRNLTYGIYSNTSGDARMVVEDSLVTGSAQYGVGFGTTSGTMQGTVEHSRFEGDFRGVLAFSSANVVVRDSIAVGNSAPASFGFSAFQAGARLNVENSLVTHNYIGLNGTGTMHVSETTIEENTTGVSGNVISFGNNRLADNTMNGLFAATIPLQ